MIRRKSENWSYDCTRFPETTGDTVSNVLITRLRVCIRTLKSSFIVCCSIENGFPGCYKIRVLLNTLIALCKLAGMTGEPDRTIN